MLTYNDEMTGYAPVELKVVDEMNRRMRLWADQYFVANSDKTKDVWFAPDEPVA